MEQFKNKRKTKMFDYILYKYGNIILFITFKIYKNIICSGMI